MSILPKSADYTSKDFDSLRARVVSLILSVFPTWTDLDVTNFGNILFEAFCFVGDVLAFAQDNQAAESRIQTATQRRNLLALVKLLNYTPALASAATVDQTFTASGLSVNCVIPAGQVVKTEGDDPVEFQLLAPITLTPGQPSAVGTVEHSKNQSQNYAGTGQADQSLALSETPFLNVVSVTGASSGTWSRASGDNFIFSGPSDKVFAVSVDNNDRATIKFGDGVAGAMPNDVLTIVYKTGGGAVGNVAANSITKIDGVLLDVSSNIVSATTANASSASGGIDRETLESIKLRAPLSITNPTTAVARTDFEDHATTAVSGVVRALMQTINEDPLVPLNAGALYVVPSGVSPGFPSLAKLNEVRRLFVGDTQAKPPFPAPLTFSLSVLPADYLDFSITAKIFLKAGFSDPATAATVKANILSALTAYFNPLLPDGTPNPSINFGYYLRLMLGLNSTDTSGQLAMSDLLDAVRDVAGVRAVGAAPADFVVTTRQVHLDVVTLVTTTTTVLTSVHQDIPVLDHQFPRLRVVSGAPDVTLIDGDTGIPL